MSRVRRRRRHGSCQLRDRARRGRAKRAAGGADAAAAGWRSGLARRRAEDGACICQTVSKQAVLFEVRLNFGHTWLLVMPVPRPLDRRSAKMLPITPSHLGRPSRRHQRVLRFCPKFGLVCYSCNALTEQSHPVLMKQYACTHCMPCKMSPQAFSATCISKPSNGAQHVRQCAHQGPRRRWCLAAAAAAAAGTRCRRRPRLRIVTDKAIWALGFTQVLSVLLGNGPTRRHELPVPEHSVAAKERGLPGRLVPRRPWT